jgi:thioredoxin 1
MGSNLVNAPKAEWTAGAGSDAMSGAANAVAGGTPVEVTAGNFKQLVERDGIVLLDWWAAWCGPCRAFAPTFEKAAAANPDLVFGKIDTEAQQELAASFQIRSIPTLMILRDQVLLFSQPGALPEAALSDLIAQVRALDMEKVRAEIAEQEKRAVGA